MTLPAFEIGRYPVTNAEYAVFVQATGCAAPLHWRGGRLPAEQAGLPEELADHPVVNVTWDDARAYAAWLREQTGRPYRLPTEAEWEKAARGEDGRLWPWGDDWDAARANCAPAGPGGTTPVGSYPDGGSPYGCLDMAGNVWQWTRSLYKDYPYDPTDGREDVAAEGARALRGGAFNFNQGDVRCAARNRDYPGNRDRNNGFRVALVFPGDSGI